MVQRKVPEEREHPVGVDLRSAWRPDLLDVPVAGFADRVADSLDQSQLGVVLDAGRDGQGADRAHRIILDPAILAHRLGRPLPSRNGRVRNRIRLVNCFVYLREDLLLGTVVQASRNVDVSHWHVLLPSWSLICNAAMTGDDPGHHWRPAGPRHPHGLGRVPAIGWLSLAEFQAEATVGSSGGAGLPGNHAGGANGKLLGQAVAQRVGGGVGAPAGVDLAVEVGYVPLDGVRAQAQP